MLSKSFRNLVGLHRISRSPLALSNSFQRRFYFDQNQNKPQKDKEIKEIKEVKETKENIDEDDEVDFPYIWMNTDELPEIPKSDD